MKHTFTLKDGQIMTTEASHVIIVHSHYNSIGKRLPSGKKFIEFYYDLEMATDALFKFCLAESDDYTTDAADNERQSDGNVIYEGEREVMTRGAIRYEYDSRFYSVEPIEELSDADIIALADMIPSDIAKSFEQQCYEVNMPRSVNMDKVLV